MNTLVKLVFAIQIIAMINFTVLFLCHNFSFMPSWSISSKGPQQPRENCPEQKSNIIKVKDEFQSSSDPIWRSCHCQPENTNDWSFGKLCLYRWENISSCIEDVDDLRELSAFPNQPSACHTIEQFHYDYDVEIYGQRIFGYVHPPHDGYYSLTLDTNSFAELWFSNGTQPEQAKRIAWIEPWQRPWDTDDADMKFRWVETQESAWLYLHQDRAYFVEVLHGQRLDKGFVDVRWKFFDGQFPSRPATISGRHISLLRQPPNYKSLIHQTQRFVRPGIGISKIFRRLESNYSRDYQTLPRLHRHFLQVLPTCHYFRPTYIVPKRRKVGKFAAFRMLRAIKHLIRGKFNFRVFNRERLLPCNAVADLQRTDHMVEKFMNILNARHRNTFELIEVIGVEEKIDPRRGSRFLFDLVVKDKSKGEIFRISEYFFFRKTSKILCLLTDLNWSMSTDVHIVLAVKGQSRWLRYFIDQVSDYYLSTKDEHFNIIISDFSNYDTEDNDHFNLENALKSSPLKRYQIIPLYEKYQNFSKTIGINAAVSSIEDKASIVLQFDLHINFPHDLLDNVRKRTFRRKTVYMPIIVRLYCGHALDNPNGYYEKFGFGIMAHAKSDYDDIGGMLTDKFKYDWGGEDSEMADRILNHQLEIERVCHPNMFHFYHRKLSWKH